MKNVDLLVDLKIKVIFIGCVQFSKSILDHMINMMNVEIVAMATKKSSSINSDFLDLSSATLMHNVPVFHYSKNNDELESFVSSIDADVIFCIGWSHLLGESILRAKPYGVVGYHPSLLPKGRGRHPIIWSLVLGHEETASSFFLMRPEADEGDIISQVSVKITYSDNAETLYNKLISIAKLQISSIISQFLSNNVIFVEQDHDLASSWRKRTRADGVIDWRASSRSIYNLVRALYRPYPGAEFIYQNKSFKVWRVEESANQSDYDEPGEILNINDTIIEVKVAGGSIRLLEYAPPPPPLLVGDYL